MPIPQEKSKKENKKTINCLLEKGGRPQGIQLIINIPAKFDERKVGVVVRNFNEAAAEKKIPIIQCRVYKGSVENIIAHITVMGKTDYDLRTNFVKPGMDVVMAGTAGIGGASVLSRICEDDLKSKFPPSFVRECMELSKMLSVEKAVQIALQHKACFMHNVSDCGVFGAIWELGSGCNKGVTVHIKDIPIWQQVIEVSELLNVNPYMLEGTGAVLIVCENGKNMVESFLENNIMSAVIGTITENNDRIVINGDETRYLEPPRGDEIYKFL